MNKADLIQYIEKKALRPVSIKQSAQALIKALEKYRQGNK